MLFGRTPIFTKVEVINMARQGENTLPPSYTSQTPITYENKSLKRETRAMADTKDSSALRPNQRVGKDSRKTGRK